MSCVRPHLTSVSKPALASLWRFDWESAAIFGKEHQYSYLPGFNLLTDVTATYLDILTSHSRS